METKNQETSITLVDFSVLKTELQKRFNTLKEYPLFQANVDKDFLWKLYLDSFPEGTDPIFRERTEHDCSSCRSFVKHAGGIVAVINGKIETLWKVTVGGQYQPVCDTLNEYVEACNIDNIFLYSENSIGHDKNFEQIENGVLTWNHLYISLPQKTFCSKDTKDTVRAEKRSTYDVTFRGLKEITLESIDLVLDLISQNSLYRGEEHKKKLEAFREIKKIFETISDEKEQKNFAWLQVAQQDSWAGRIRNEVIGTLLVDLSDGVPLEKALTAFEKKVAPANYKRPTSVITPKMKEAAKAKIEELGFISALERRYATLSDIKVTDVLFANRDAKKRMTGDIFDELPTTGKKLPNLDKIEEISIEDFINNVLPTAKSIEILFESKLTPNLVSLIAPVDVTAKTMFKWPNPYSWTYNGDVADSDIREMVKRAGGKVDGVLRFSHSWNHKERNSSLMDLHIFLPGSNISPEGGTNDAYGNNERVGWNNRYHQKTRGNQDVDYVDAAPAGFIPVENITFPDMKLLPEGRYICKIHNWHFRHPTTGGFRAEIEFGGQVFEYDHPAPLKNKQWVTVAVLNLSKSVFTIEHKLTPTAGSSVKVWNLNSNEFHPVTAICYSPNYWGNSSVGNKHYFFMVDQCKNESTARGFYNEFLNSELEPHRKTMEILGSKVRTDISEDQFSGLGFSSTQRNSVVVRVESSFTRTLRVNF